MRCMRKAGDYRELLYTRRGRRDNGVDVKWDVKMQNGVKSGKESRVGEIRRYRSVAREESKQTISST